MATPTKTERTFDCVDFKRRAQAEILKQIQGMTHEQERAYFQQQADRGPLGEWWNHVKSTSTNRNTA